MGIEYEETLAYLEREREVWLNYRDRNIRAIGLDSALVEGQALSMIRLNFLLEDLFRQNVTIELES